MTQENEVIDHAKMERYAETATSKIVSRALLGVLSIAVSALAWSVGKWSDHFDRIDAYMARADTKQEVMRADVDTLKALVPIREAQLKEIRDMALDSKFRLDHMGAK